MISFCNIWASKVYQIDIPKSGRFKRAGCHAVLQNDTAAGSLPLLECKKGSSGGGFKHIVDALSAQTGAFQISLGSDFSGYAFAIVSCNKSLGFLAHLFNGNRIIPQILFQPNEDDGYTFAKTRGLFDPL